MAAALASSNSKNFWKHVKNANRSKKSTSAHSIDGHSGDEISSLFSSKFQSILNSQDVSERDSFLSDLSNSLSTSDLESISISEECVSEAFSHLKKGKSDGSLLVSDHLIYALPAVGSSIAKLFTSILRHMVTYRHSCVTVFLSPSLRALKILSYLMIIMRLHLLLLRAKH